jgi:hypothetical protein
MPQYGVVCTYTSLGSRSDKVGTHQCTVRVGTYCATVYRDSSAEPGGTVTGYYCRYRTGTPENDLLTISTANLRSVCCFDDERPIVVVICSGDFKKVHYGVPWDFRKAEDFDIKESTTCGRTDNKCSGIEHAESLGMVMINLHSVPGTSKSGWKIIDRRYLRY